MERLTITCLFPFSLVKWIYGLYYLILSKLTLLKGKSGLKWVLPRSHGSKIILIIWTQELSKTLFFLVRDLCQPYCEVKAVTDLIKVGHKILSRWWFEIFMNQLSLTMTSMSWRFLTFLCVTDPFSGLKPEGRLLRIMFLMHRIHRIYIEIKMHFPSWSGLIDSLKFIIKPQFRNLCPKYMLFFDIVAR